MVGKKLARQVEIFSGDAQACCPAHAVSMSDLIKVCHCCHINPALGNRNDDICVAKTQWQQQVNAGFGCFNLFTDQIFAGDAKVNETLIQIARNFRRRLKSDVYVRHALKSADVFTSATALFDLKARLAKEVVGVFLQSSFRRNGDDEIFGSHDHVPPIADAWAAITRRRGLMAQPTAGTG